MTPHRSTGQAAGLLPISITQKGAVAGPSKPSASKPTAPRLKLLVRRLPPGLTQPELETLLGEEWKVGGKKVDWLSFKEGKVSTTASKPSRPSRAYIRVTSLSLVQDLSDKVRTTTFQDARNTIIDPVLIGPPTLEYAPYPRVPGGKARKDARQGTIDQDVDFIAFLESLTNPVAKAPVDLNAETEKAEKVTTTPLIQYLKEKKANKAKEPSSPAKPTKHSRAEAKEAAKASKVQAKKLLSRAERAAPAASEKPSKLDRATKEAVRAANKQAAAQAPKASGKAQQAPPAAKESKPAPAPSPAPERKRERGDISAATKILRRDLGLGPPNPSRRRGEKPTVNTNVASSKVNEPASPATERVKTPSTPRGPKADSEAAQKNTPAKAGRAPPTEPAATRNAAKQANQPLAHAKSPPSRQKQQPQPPAPPESTSTQAFLKHANPSQGVTEELLEAGFSKFGKVVKVEIDKKKGFGYVDFAEPEGLRKAIQGSPVQIAQSQVVVLERKSGAAVAQARRSNLPPPSGPVGGRGAAGNNNNNNNNNAPPSGPRQAPPQGPRGGRGGGRGRGGFPKGGRHAGGPKGGANAQGPPAAAKGGQAEK
ncbi:hypothetical protein AJ80_04808 [Polytolypa hystricis UAMH7299]|uniref:RRM domain-containing protein n=1 Tax=Polytolypa hystricis (strain UAMH7299) TaxID=1447883 RepID=A0A2B7Y945_POLH7|nr:hypothetical protein AJ80_04808 [Polytolypa hystricis UAMH7299]